MKNNCSARGLICALVNDCTSFSFAYAQLLQMPHATRNTCRTDFHKRTDLFLGWGQHEVVLGVAEAHHHALHAVLASARQHAEEVNAKGSGQLSSAANEVQLLQEGQIEAPPPQPVL